jgi:hypothetical protein
VQDTSGTLQYALNDADTAGTVGAAAAPEECEEVAAAGAAAAERSAATASARGPASSGFSAARCTNRGRLALASLSKQEVVAALKLMASKRLVREVGQTAVDR